MGIRSHAGRDTARKDRLGHRPASHHDGGDEHPAQEPQHDLPVDEGGEAPGGEDAGQLLSLRSGLDPGVDRDPHGLAVVRAL